ncbi:alpha-2-macroglobulin family protein [Gymnodinialimonas sp. 2305UL16-5]|uniref:alpha-2-macroglobulin family protein n=1 Tax=Gymnodinialimonas mytili TaxID=3126503 RepID=UPI0030A62B09
MPMRRALRLLAVFFCVLPNLATISAAQSPVPDRVSSLIRDVDLPGNDLRPIFDTTLSACDAACRADPDCMAFTFNTANNTCFPKTAAGEAITYSGAISGVIRNTAAEVLTHAEAQRGNLQFLNSADFDTAQSQASGLDLVHFGGQFDPEQWREGAARLADDGNHLGAMRMLGAAVTLTHAASDWTAYAQSLLSIEAENNAAGREFERQAVEAATNAALRAEDGAEFAAALDQLALALERRGRGRAALDAAVLAFEQDPTDIRNTALTRLRGLFGFRVTETRVDNEADFPRICATFSEPLAAGGVIYDDFLQSRHPGLTVEADGRSLCLSGVEHGARYEVTLRAGLPAASGEVLHSPITLRQYVRDRSPSVRFAGRAYILPASAGSSIPVVGVNTDLIDLRLFHVADRNILRTLQQDYFGRPLAEWQVDQFGDEIGEEVWQGAVDVATEPNRSVTTRIPIGEVLQGRAPGLYALEARVGGAGTSDGGATQWFLVSDLGLTAMSGADGVHVLVRSLATTQAHADVTLDLISDSNRVLGSAQTNAEGYAHFPTGLTAGQDGAAPALLTARMGDTDLAFLSLRDAEFDLSDRGVDGREPAQAIDVFLTTDRGAYRAGETIHATALARDPSVAAITGLPLTAILTRADGVEYTRQVLTEIGAGGYVFSLALDQDVPRGTWRLAIHADPDAPPLTQTRLLVEDFLPERLDLSIDLPEQIRSADAPPTVTFDAQYLFGASAAELPISGRLALRPTFELFEYPNYRFGRHDAAPDPVFASLAPQLTNSEGQLSRNLDLPEFEGVTHPGVLTLTAQITEGSGRPLERSATATILPDAPMIGIRPLFDSTLQRDTDAAFDVLATGTETLPARWTLNRVERRYQWYRQGGNWTWEPVTTRTQIANGEITLGADPARISAPVDRGNYELRVESATGGFAVSSVGFSAGWYNAQDGSDTPDTLDVSLDAQTYAPGDTATLRIVPRQGGLAVIQVLSDRVIDRQLIEIGDDPVDIPLPVTEDWGSGAYVTASLIRPLETVSGPAPTRALGLAHATLVPGDRRLETRIDAPETTRPRGPLAVTLHVADAEPGEVVHATIAAVDVGILNLTGFEAPDPEGHYFGQRRLGVAFRDVYGRLIDSRDGAEGRIRQGGDAGAGLRAQSPPPGDDLVALFSGPLIVGADGRVTTEFDIPAFNGTLRLMATTWSDTGIGQASAEVIIRDPIVVTASAPRFLAPGDQGRILLEFTHTEGPTGTFPLSISASPLIDQWGELPENVTLTEGTTTRLSLPFRVADNRTGTLSASFDLTLPNDELLDQTVSIPVVANDPSIAETTRLTLEPGQSFTLDATAFTGFQPGTARVTLSGGPLAQFDVAGLLQRLDRHPGGSTEQITSHALPLLYLAQVAELMDLGTADDLSERIDDAIRGVLTNQAANGGFGQWRAQSGDLWLDAYVTDFLSRARAEGHEVPAIPFQSALDNLANRVAGHPDFENAGEGLAYALMVLAREGQASMGDLRYYADVKASEFATPLALGQLGAALAMYGDQVRADAMFTAGFARLTLIATDEENASWRDDYGSRARDAVGLVALAAFAGSETANAIDLTADILPDLDTASTQEAVWSLLAAQALMESPDATGLALDGAPVSGPLVQVLGPDPTQTRIIENIGNRDEMLTLTRFGVPDGLTEAFGNGYRITRRYQDFDGAPVDPSTVPQGTRLVAILSVERFGAPDGRLLITDPLPAGFEIDNPNLLRATDLPNLGRTTAYTPRMSQFLSDRFQAAIHMRRDDPIELAYTIRAVTPGEFHQPAASIVDMYRPTFRAQTASGQVTITVPE